MRTTPLQKKIQEKKLSKFHVTAIRVPQTTWRDLTKVSKTSEISINAIVNVAITELIKKETKKYNTPKNGRTT